MTSTWRLSLTVPAPSAIFFEGALEPFCSATWVDQHADGAVRVHAFADDLAQRDAVEIALSIAAAARNLPPPDLHIALLDDHDWASASALAFPAFRVGRFLIHGSGETPPVRGGAVPLRIDARMAFGSGRHASTAMCLTALSRLTPHPRRALDLGCGSGILAVAMAKLWRARVVAADIDPVAVADARDNAIGNRVRPLMTVVRSDGYAAPVIDGAKPFDLIVANILPRPLKLLARETMRYVEPRGHVVLSGFRAEEANDVLAAHRACGARLIDRLESEGWQALVLRRAR